MRIRNFKKIILPLCALVAIGTGIGGTIAYFTHLSKKNNSFTIGENAISITEDFTPPKELQQGMNIYKKQVEILNTGTTEAFIRVYAAFSDSDIANQSFIAANQPDSVSIASDASYDDAAIEMINAGYKKSADFFAEDVPSNDWIYISNSNDMLGGYFYYTKKVAPGDKTSSLINTVATYFANSNDIKDYELIIYAESVQTADKNGVVFQDNEYQDAWSEYLSRR